MARIVRQNDESVREGYIRNGGKKVKLFKSALKAFQCNNRIVVAQRKHLDDFLRGRIIVRLECGRTQLEVSAKLGIAKSVISRLWQRFQEGGNKQSTTSDLSRRLSSATGTTVSRQTVYRRLGRIGLYTRRPVRWVPLTATHCRLRLTWSREHALWIPQQWSCVMFSDESRFSLQPDSRRTLIWTAPGTRYHQENTIEQHHYGGAEWLVWGRIILGSRTDLHVESVTMTGHIYRDVFLEQHDNRNIWCGRSSLVSKVTDSWLACHEFEPSNNKDPPCKEGHCTLNLSMLKRPPVGVAWKLGEEEFQLGCCPRHLTIVQDYEAYRQKSSSS
ncbi:transposable element Tcb1 transposase [Trichonephila clavipes]|uniref:Transposable element Tcb1 transposase n=1 Tax=Trichonephila clavipes TaxID=2585209 RepID=A0A8X6VIC3_TRICX|nr:transposable element Tcb1 transposase [Trichonephila clavipes]